MDDVNVDVMPTEPVVDIATANNGHEARGAKKRRVGADGGKIHVKARIDVGDK